MENKHPNPHATDDLILSAVDSVKQKAEHEIHRVEVYTRRSPLMALAIATATGYVLRSVPVLALTGLFLRLGLVLLRPFIFIMGAVNVYDFIRSRRQTGTGSGGEYSPGEHHRN